MIEKFVKGYNRESFNVLCIFCERIQVHFFIVGYACRKKNYKDAQTSNRDI